MKGWRRYLLFAPSLGLGLLAAIWLYFRPLPYTPKFGLIGQLGVAALLIGLFLGIAWLLERYLPSFRYASKLLERAMMGIRISLWLAIFLAVASAVSEELFFRGALMPLITVWGQALLFGLMHPAPRKAWSYTVFTFLAGLGFGFATLLTGSLWPAILAHFAVNLQGFLEIKSLQDKQRARIASYSAPIHPSIKPELTPVKPETELTNELNNDSSRDIN